MGWFSDFVSDPLGTVDQTVRNNVPGGWAGAAALGAGAYAMPEGSLSGLFGSTSAPEIGTGLETGMATPDAATGVDWANAPDQSAAETARLGAQDASATGVPIGSQSLGSMFGNAASSVGDWIGKNPITSIYGAGSLYDMYAKKQMANKQQDLYNQNRSDIMGMYAPGSAEYNSLMNEMSRKDAAAGRNSQYGARAVDLAGKIASYKTTALANMQNGQNGLANQSIGNQFGMMNTPLTLAALTATQK